MKFRTLLLILTACFCLYNNTVQAQEKRVKAVWIATHFGLDWPPENANLESQKQDMRAKLDKLKALNINTVFFQTRCRADVFYRSSIEPMSRFAYLSPESSFDPLAFVIDECHKRNMECHAWFNTFIAGGEKQGDTIVNTFPYPAFCLFNFNQKADYGWWLDPGNPMTTSYLLQLLMEIVINYDIDGIHFDHLRYPDEKNTFDDSASYRRFAGGVKKEDWRRNNITKFLRSAYQMVKMYKPWVQVSSVVIGAYKPLPQLQNSGYSTAFYNGYQNVEQWVQEGIVDMVCPMMYNNANFDALLKAWKQTSGKRILLPCLAAYRLEKKYWTCDTIVQQMSCINSEKIYNTGFYRCSYLTDTAYALFSALTAIDFAKPAALPAMPWLNLEPPMNPFNLQGYSMPDRFLQLNWECVGNNSYTIYASTIADFSNPEAVNVVASGITGKSYRFQPEAGKRFFAVKATNRAHIESGLSNYLQLY